MKTAIRLDDITPDMDYDKFYKVKAILDEAGIKPLIGVVPFCADETLHIEDEREDFGTFLIGLKNCGWKIALHGYNHVYRTTHKGCFPLNDFSEFAGVPYEKQYEMISWGKTRLTEWGVIPKIFMAPGHTFDKNTLKALKACDIEMVTDGFGNRPYVRDGIIFYPISKRRSECISEHDGYSTYVLHTNTMSNIMIEEFAKLINDNRDKFISFDEYMKVDALNRNAFGVAKEYLLALMKHYLVSRRASKGTVVKREYK